MKAFVTPIVLLCVLCRDLPVAENRSPAFRLCARATAWSNTAFIEQNWQVTVVNGRYKCSFADWRARTPDAAAHSDKTMKNERKANKAAK